MRDKTKAGKNRPIPIHDNIKDLITEVIEYANSFNTYNNMHFKIEKYVSDYQWEHTLYDARHTFATLAKESGISNSARASIMGINKTTSQMIFILMNLSDICAVK